MFTGGHQTGGEAVLRLRVLLLAVMSTLALVPTSGASNTPAQTAALCGSLFGSTFGAPSSEPLASCQWDMSLIGATASRPWTGATGRGVSVGVIDSGVDVTHPDVAPNLDLARSCSFIFSTTPTALPQEVGTATAATRLRCRTSTVTAHMSHQRSQRR